MVRLSSLFGKRQLMVGPVSCLFRATYMVSRGRYKTQTLTTKSRARSSWCCGISLSHGLVLYIDLISFRISLLDRITRLFSLVLVTSIFHNNILGRKIKPLLTSNKGNVSCTVLGWSHRVKLVTVCGIIAADLFCGKVIQYIVRQSNRFKCYATSVNIVYKECTNRIVAARLDKISRSKISCDGNSLSRVETWVVRETVRMKESAVGFGVES